mgnify:CR=1 FL=1
MINTRVIKIKTQVLVVNDNAVELASLESGLRAEGFQVTGTIDPFSALDILAHSHFDVVLIDLMIAQMNGLQLARKIRDAHPTTNTMLMSDYLLSPVQLAKADTGAVGFIPKPCNFSEIAEFINGKITERSYKGEASHPVATTHSPFDVLTVRYSY